MPDVSGFSYSQCQKVVKMFLFVFLLVCCASTLHGAPLAEDEVDGKIIGGRDIEINTVPYQLSLEHKNRHTCGASILNQRYALSAAHCVNGYEPGNFRLRAGTSIRQRGGTIHHVKTIVINKRFNPKTVDYDVSLLEVIEPFVIGSVVQPIPITSVEPKAGQTGVVTGWGSTKEGQIAISQKLQVVQVPILERTGCVQRYLPFGGVTQRMICAGAKKHDSCQGDSGGPLVVEGRLAGIVSWGIGCGRGGYPGVYTNVANPDIHSWIEKNSNIEWKVDGEDEEEADVEEDVKEPKTKEE